MEKIVMSHKKRNKIKTTIIFIVLVIVSLLSLFPFYWMLLNSFKNPDKIIGDLSFFTFDLVISSYVQVFETNIKGTFFDALGTSVLISSLVTVGTLFTSSLAAFAFAKIKFKGSKLLYAVFIATMMVPGQVTMLPLFLMFSTAQVNLDIQLIGTIIPLVLPGMLVNTYGVFMLRQFIVSIPNELMEAAEMDGCTAFRKYWQIIIPLCKPALISLGLFTFIGCFNNYLGQLIYLSSGDNVTIPLFIQSLYSASDAGSQWGRIMAATTLSTVPIAVIYLSCQKYFVEGIATTGIK